MKLAAAFVLGIMVALGGRTDETALQQALADYAKTSSELRQSSAVLRQSCLGPRMQLTPYQTFRKEI